MKLEQPQQLSKVKNNRRRVNNRVRLSEIQSLLIVTISFYHKTTF